MGLDCGGKCGLYFLVFLNFLFLLLGLGLTIIGIIMQVNSDTLGKTEVLALFNQISFNGSLNLGTVINDLSILIIAIGVFILIIAALGLLGACCRARCVLVVYAMIVLVLFVVQCVCVALWFTMKDKVENTVKDNLNTIFVSYAGAAATDETSVGWNLMFIGYECCGVDALSSTSNDQEFSPTTWWSSRGSNLIPYSCCKTATEDNYKTGIDNTCTQSLSGHYETGCYDAFKNWITKYQTAAIAVGVILLFIEILAIIMAFVLCRAVAKQDIIV